jgi:hypothetical protein
LATDDREFQWRTDRGQQGGRDGLHRPPCPAVRHDDLRRPVNGRFVGGTYFLQRRAPGLTGVDFDSGSLIGLRFTGLVKVREFVLGYEWSRFQWRPDRRGPLDVVLTEWLRLFLSGRFDHYRRHYRDVHERYVLFEVRPWRGRGVPVPVRDPAGRLRLVRVRLQPVDVR